MLGYLLTILEGVCIETLPLKDTVKAKKTAHPKVSRGVLNDYGVIAVPFLNRKVIELS